jgi:hypothetical protein
VTPTPEVRGGQTGKLSALRFPRSSRADFVRERRRQSPPRPSLVVEGAVPTLSIDAVGADRSGWHDRLRWDRRETGGDSVRSASASRP